MNVQKLCLFRAVFLFLLLVGGGLPGCGSNSAPEVPNAEPTAAVSQSVVNSLGDVTQFNGALSGIVRLSVGGVGGCTGTLIAANLVLTAAHCFDVNVSNQPHTFQMAPGPVEVRLDSAPGSIPHTFSIPVVAGDTVFVNPDYHSGFQSGTYAPATAFFDMAVIRFPRSFSPTLTARLVDRNKAVPLRVAQTNPERSVFEGDPTGLAGCQQASSDPTTCMLLGHTQLFAGYGQTTEGGNAVPWGKPALFGYGNINGLQEGFSWMPDSGKYDNAYIVYIIEPGGPYPSTGHGDSGGPGLFLPSLRDAFSQTDALWDRPTIIAVHSQGGPSSFRQARVTGDSNRALLESFRDQDGDSVDDWDDLCPLDPNNQDDDGDGLGGPCDPCPRDGNVYQSLVVLATNTTDSDGDGTADACDDCEDDVNEVFPGKDGDKDGVCGIVLPGHGEPDNCPAIFNDKQENSNRDSEEAHGAKLVGDACEPVPTPVHSFEKEQIDLGCTSGPGVNYCFSAFVVNGVDLTPRGSFGTGEPPGDPAMAGVEVPIDVAQTNHRYCIHDDAVGANCYSSTAIADKYLALTIAQESTLNLWHRVRVGNIDPQPSHTGPLTYATATPAQGHSWLWKVDFAVWQKSPWGSSWVPDVTIPTDHSDIIASGFGRYWTNADSVKVGMKGGPVNLANQTGVHTKTDGTEAEQLANYYSDVFPVMHATKATKFTLTYEPELLGWDRPCAACGPRELFEDLRQRVTHPDQWSQTLANMFASGESRPLVKTQSGVGILTTQGTVLEMPPESLGASILPALQTDHVLVQQAEANPMIGRGIGAPHSLVLSPDGTTIVESLFGPAELLVSGSDLSPTHHQPPASMSVPQDIGVQQAASPTPRLGFQAVYSRATSKLFVIGGIDSTTHLPSGDIWLHDLGPSGGWTPIEVPGYQPQSPLAATYSYLDGRLWILDEKPMGAHGSMARLVAIGTDQRAVTIGSWPRLKHFDRHWLLLDRDGSILLVASSTKLRKYAIFRFTALGSGVRLVRMAAGYLPSAPVVDLAGYGFIVRKNDNSPSTLVRVRELGHGAALSSTAMGAYL